MLEMKSTGTKTTEFVPTPTRRAVLQALLWVTRDGIHSQAALAKALTQKRVTEFRDRALATHIFFGVLRWKRRLDAILRPFVRRDLNQTDSVVLMALRMAIYQLRFLDRIPPHAAVSDAVSLVREVRGGKSAGFCNAVLRKIVTAPAEVKPPTMDAAKLAVWYCHPDWLVERWATQVPDLHDLERLCAAYSEPAPSVVRLKMGYDTPERVLGWLAKHPETTATCGTMPNALILEGVDPLRGTPFEQGWWLPQDEAAQWVTTLLAPCAGARILDVCSGTGTKTTHLAEFAGPDGIVVALDIHPAKMDELERLIQKWRPPAAVRTVVADATLPFPRSCLGFDRILVDAPCTGLGTIRRRPEIKWRVAPHRPAEMAALQSAILHNAAMALNIGGILVYCVCTPTEEEGPEVIQRFLAENGSAFNQLPIQGCGNDGFLRTSPLVGGMDAFFAAVLTRTA